MPNSILEELIDSIFKYINKKGQSIKNILNPKFFYSGRGKFMIIITRINNLVFILLLYFWSISCGPRSLNSKGESPNIIWLVAEDLGPYIPAFGDSTVDTPNFFDLAIA